MKLPKDYTYINLMLGYDPKRALEMAYEMGYEDGQIKELAHETEYYKNLAIDRDVDSRR